MLLSEGRGRKAVNTINNMAKAAKGNLTPEKVEKIIAQNKTMRARWNGRNDMATMRGAFKGRRGSTLVIEGVAQATAAGMNPTIGQKPDQLSPDLSKSMTDETLAAAREGVGMAYGVLPSFFNRAATGPVIREAQRQLAIWTLQPIASMLADEATAKLGAEVTIDTIRPLQAFDAGGRARALSAIIKTLVEAKVAGLAPADVSGAMRMVDWER